MYIAHHYAQMSYTTQHRSSDNLYS